MSPTYSRRAVLAGTGAAAAAAATAALSGCEVARTADAPPSGTSLGRTADVPVGGGHVLSDLDVVVTQPEAGTFKAFSALCTHRGCRVDEVSDGEIVCPCHISRFAISDGSVTFGPADQPLPAFKLKVSGDEIMVA
ncbi:Rieske (2Fe-2S) protein [Microbispora amethystogenes]|uniref:Cytochrome bc1 complex Rieske iron-sulfur subunit n=1 Tax=Microbispora amethystogenes TaxID=1427754 RepID=A0ABQ4FP71_9ACTN|nr:Rieske (2Fe-2S) protein [Microbispora amethystogenes]GIH36600.1 iron-sulfur protein [Microbispora amethystogenes]